MQLSHGCVCVILYCIIKVSNGHAYFFLSQPWTNRARVCERVLSE